MKKIINYLLLISIFFIGMNNISAKGEIANCNYKSDDGKIEYKMSIKWGGDISGKFKAKGVITKYNGKSTSNKEDVIDFDSAEQRGISKLKITNICPEELRINKSFGYNIFAEENDEKGKVIKLSNSFNQNKENEKSIREYFGLDSNFKCEYKFNGQKKTYTFIKNYIDALYDITKNTDVYSSTTCDSKKIYMICKNGSTSNCFYSGATSKPKLCNNSDTDCYLLSTKEDTKTNNDKTDEKEDSSPSDDKKDDSSSNKKEENVKEYKQIYEIVSKSKSNKGDKLTFTINFDVNNNELKQQSIVITNSNDNSTFSPGIAYTNSVDAYKISVIDSVVSNNAFPKKIYCGDTKNSQISLSPTAVYISKNDYICSPTKDAFNGASLLAVYSTDVKKTAENDSEVVDRNYLNGCTDLGETLTLLKQIYTFLRYMIPVLIIVLSIVDFIKVVASGDDKNYKTAYNRFIKRIIVGIVILLLPFILSLLIRISGIATDTGIDTSSYKTLFCIFE